MIREVDIDASFGKFQFVAVQRDNLCVFVSISRHCIHRAAVDGAGQSEGGGLAMVLAI